MAIPISAHCRACERKLLLRELTTNGSASCPSCGAPLTRGYAFLLLEEARRAETLAGELAASLQRLATLPGNLVIDRDEVHAAITAPLPAWAQEQADRELIVAEAEAARRSVRDWTRMSRRERVNGTPRLVAKLRTIGERLVALARPERTDESSALNAAATEVERAADAVSAERLHAGVEATKALHHAERVVKTPETRPAPKVEKAATASEGRRSDARHDDRELVEV